MMKKTRIYFVLIALLTANTAFSQQGIKEKDKPLNIIIVIGDGMGLSQLSAPYFYQRGEPVFSSFKQIALVRTSSATHKVTDSAASGSAIFGGRKTYNGAIGVGLDSLPLPNLVEQFSKANYLTGVISTASITDATPGAFYAHQLHRSYHKAIANDLLHSEIDFFAGGGLQHFIDTTGIDYFKNHEIEVNLSKLNQFKNSDPNKRYGYLLAMNGLAPMLNGRKNFLPKASELAIKHLSKSENGFLLMIEAAQIDWAGHSNNADYMITEMEDFEKTVQVIYDFAKKDKHTLVIVTSDHETGGFTLAASGKNSFNGDYSEADYNIITPSFSTTNHSAAMVPLLAFGPGAETFFGIMQNTDIYYKLIDLMK